VAVLTPQANLGTTIGGKSLLMMWTEAVLNRLSPLVAWPVESLKMDDLYR
jgi:hypothetical protein